MPPVPTSIRLEAWWPFARNVFPWDLVSPGQPPSKPISRSCCSASPPSKVWRSERDLQPLRCVDLRTTIPGYLLPTVRFVQRPITLVAFWVGCRRAAPIWGHVAIKPTSSIAKEQKSVDVKTGEPAALSVRGRHDPIIAVPRRCPSSRRLSHLAWPTYFFVGRPIAISMMGDGFCCDCLLRFRAPKTSVARRGRRHTYNA